MATFISLGTLSLSSSRFFSLGAPTRYHGYPNRPVLPPLKCSSSSSDSDTAMPPNGWAHKLTAGLAGIGFLETSYLTYLKLTESEAFCPVGGATCSDILNSDYAIVFGFPLPMIGMAAYGLVASLSLQLATNNLAFGINKSNAQLVLLGITTSMAAASAYFLYILTTRFSGSSCSYCLLSVLLSFTLFFVTVKDLGLQETYKQVGLQLFIASLVILTLNTSYSNSKSASSSLAEVELPYYATEITTPSSPFAISLARYLQSIGAKMYGAFWCSHCLEQKEMFGREAAKQLDYVECFPEGYRTGTKMIKACMDAKIEGFPTWIINGQVLSGEQELSELSQVSGYNESVQPS
ncbi:thiol-disulfide oxidoreductase LTO1 isoform X2 [Gastrolobium bilobum]|uniref:thiol-disulfide oxidoreductase LTO1 isoform X2 n=1 Tax=Gastrolobium bilobum TaxID=150636 RepID=UPI002AB1420B|nr:thiol-disulfide oxidoreductase LTO1 isoform X2 [Gastrolobium bilobum]